MAVLCQSGKGLRLSFLESFFAIEAFSIKKFNNFRVPGRREDIMFLISSSEPISGRHLCAKGGHRIRAGKLVLQF